MTAHTPHPADAKRRLLLDAAVDVFAQFGYQKTSMDDVARAAGVSRQGLYLHFADKQDLFRATVEHALDTQLGAGLAVLADEARPLEDRLVGAFREWLGRRVGFGGSDASDLIGRSNAIAGPRLVEHAARIDEAVAQVIAASPLAAIYAEAKLKPIQLARTLHATAVGLKYGATSPDEFSANMAVAVRVLCMPDTLGRPRAPRSARRTISR